jgi:hypothetical protein
MLPEYCCVARVLKRVHRAAAQQCLDQTRHSINLRIVGLLLRIDTANHWKDSDTFLRLEYFKYISLIVFSEEYKP